MSSLFQISWHALAALAVLFVPSLTRFGEPVWAIAPDQLPQMLVMGMAYLAAAVGVTLARQGRRHREVRVLLVAGVCFASASTIVLLRPDIPFSRAVIGTAALLGVALATAPTLLEPWRRPLLGVLFAGVVGSAILGLARAGPPAPRPFGFDPGVDRPSIVTSQARLRVTYHDRLIGPQRVRGGGIVPENDGFLLVTGTGEFFRLDWDDDGELGRSRLPFNAPLNYDEFVADHGRPLDWTFFRVADILLGPEDEPRSLYVSHHHWNAGQRCVTLRVSRTRRDVEPSGDNPTEGWSTLFESQPCLPIAGEFVEIPRVGGEMAWGLDGRLLLTTGDHGYDGLVEPGVSQDPDSDWGKLLAIDSTGVPTVLASGLRNPQGLALDREGQVWLTDQGPEGGDEINALVVGSDYGWPAATYGTDYGDTRWPLDPDRRTHEGYEEPLYVWVPSVAPSSLILTDSEMFPAWRGDLLAGSLRAMSLYRIRTSMGRVAYAEPITIGRRVRDLAEGSDGTIVVWTEDGGLVSIAEAADDDSAEALYAQCATCHEDAEETPATAPPLRGVYGRTIASVRGYPYSEALLGFGGRWTDNLAEFIRDPSGVVPGTSMEFEGIQDEERIRALVDFLRSYR